MNKLKGALILFVIFIASICCSFYFDESYRKLIRHLYVVLSNGKISFFIQKLYLHFPGAAFVLSSGLFMITLIFLAYRQTTKQQVVNIAFGLLLFFASILTQSYLDSFFIIVECTACSDGTIKLNYSDISYDLIFISSLLLAIIPVATTEVKKFIKRKKEQG
ncbi:hypothetical protein BH11BAC3_BH11BAC3_12670 [soil metagenome]